jgi:glyoxylase-like metal-dependent hydrolase (beta-lactamase superfamily II)
MHRASRILTSIAGGALALVVGVPIASGTQRLTATPPSKLHLEEVGSDSTAFFVISTLIVGPTEILLWDAQYHVADARRVADRIAASGKRLKAIVLSHPDHDHFAGTAAIVERFPGTPVYMTAAGLAEFNKTGRRDFQNEKSRRPAMFPDSVVTPSVLPSMHLTVDGEDVEVIPDLQGDVLTPTNSVLWIPSLQTALAGDVAFNGVHPWLGSSTEASRTAWRGVVTHMASLHPAAVVAGHKKDVNAPDSPDVLTFMDNYLRDFDALRASSPDAAALRAAMLLKYPDLAVGMLLNYSAQVAYRK